MHSRPSQLDDRDDDDDATCPLWSTMCCKLRTTVSNSALYDCAYTGAASIDHRKAWFSFNTTHAA